MHNNSCPFSSYTFLIFVGFPDSSVGKESACSVGDLGSIPGLGILEKGKATLSSILAWRTSWGRKKSDTPERLPLSLV